MPVLFYHSVIHGLAYLLVKQEINKAVVVAVMSLFLILGNMFAGNMFAANKVKKLSFEVTEAYLQLDSDLC